MILDIGTAWLYAFSSSGDQQANTHYTVFVANPRQAETTGQDVLVQTCLSYLVTVSGEGAGTLIHSYKPVFGPEIFFDDFKYNSLRINECVWVTFGLNATGAEAYALATIFVLD